MNNESEARRKAVIYARVSSAEQVKKGQEAESQASSCEHYARFHRLDVIKTFKDKGVSGRVSDRPAMKEMLAFLRKNRKLGLVVIIDDISRLARNQDAHWELRAVIADAGAELLSPQMEFAALQGGDRFNESIQAAVAEQTSWRIAKTSRSRREGRLRNGYWPFVACLGFKMEPVPGHGKMLMRHEPLASIIQEALEGYASGRFQTQAEVQRFFESQPEFPKGTKGHVHPQKVRDILTRPHYAGLVSKPEWGIPLTKG